MKNKDYFKELINEMREEEIFQISNSKINMFAIILNGIYSEGIEDGKSEMLLRVNNKVTNILANMKGEND